jgi:hypothetical protein
MQVPLHIESQHTPPRHEPLAQSVPLEQVTAPDGRQTADASQAHGAAPQLPPAVSILQVSASEAVTTEMHVPSEPEPLQRWQTPSHAASQQTPSTQKPVAHSKSSLHELPALLP